MWKPEDLIPFNDCLDLTHVEELRSLSEPGGNDFFLEVAELYVTTVENLLADLRESLASGDLSQARHAVHTLKGAAGNIGGYRVQKDAEKIELFCKSGEAPPAGYLAELEKSNQRLLEAINVLRVA
jgi:HPt (histidine-containing phosphotransfer) domain-containing protein